MVKGGFSEMETIVERKEHFGGGCRVEHKTLLLIVF